MNKKSGLTRKIHIYNTKNAFNKAPVDGIMMKIYKAVYNKHAFLSFQEV